jgi:hypothetical protein
MLTTPQRDLGVQHACVIATTTATQAVNTALHLTTNHWVNVMGQQSKAGRARSVSQQPCNCNIANAHQIAVTRHQLLHFIQSGHSIIPICTRGLPTRCCLSTTERQMQPHPALHSTQHIAVRPHVRCAASCVLVWPPLSPTYPPS